MKIAVLSFTSGRSNRGVETVVFELCRRWERRHQVRLYQHKKMWWQKIFRDLWGWRPDIVLPMNRDWQAVLSRLFCWLAGSKLVISGQAGLEDRLSLLVLPDVFVALSKQAKTWAQKFAPWVRTVLIPNGVDLKKFTPAGEKFNFALQRPLILCVAGGERYKRVEETIKAVSLLPKASLLLAGGDKRQEIFGKKLLGERFLRKKFPYRAMPAVYRAADVFTLVSESTEAFGICYLEALACGLPVVAPGDNLRWGILGREGIYVKNIEDIQEYAAKLKQAIEKGKKRPPAWLEKFSWEKVAKRYEQFFKQLISQP